MKKWIAITLGIFLIFAVGVAYGAGWVQALDSFGYGHLRPSLEARNIHFFETITKMGNTGYLAAFTVFVAVLLWLHRRRKAAFSYIGFVLLSSVLVNQVLKPIFQRVRPSYGMIQAGGYSFPSGHAAVSTVVYGIAFAAICLFAPCRSLYKWLVGALLVALIGAIMWSRVYLGVHYLSDVLAGFFLGAAHIALFLQMRGDER